MKVIYNKYFPFGSFFATNIFGIIFCRSDKGRISETTKNHEYIHTMQQREMLFIFFYLAYVIEWLVRLPMRGNAYRNISFEREAYANQRNMDYLKSRPLYAWRRYFKRRPHYQRSKKMYR